jgi:hypothetical protein
VVKTEESAFSFPWSSVMGSTSWGIVAADIHSIAAISVSVSLSSFGADSSRVVNHLIRRLDQIAHHDSLLLPPRKTREQRFKVAEAAS